ncbi:MAG: hypothetical protein B7Z35_03965 [Hydrogenophilales bacterium 12-61-10]|nr:MAG: hypothetical protein B7Z35_03965 [Hydrogenophilales bacterium 12-61-10]OYX30979.1 MAG: hypothetical protein B7Z03_05145 [Hydrogenophilales bacterium 32-62-9]
MNTLSTSPSPAQALLNKVPAITLSFWTIKVLATTVGETAADFLNFNLGIGLTNTSLLMAALFAVALVAQMRTRQLRQSLYWLVVVLVSVVGTLVTDNLVDNFGVSLTLLTPVFAVALLATFGIWFAREKTLSMHHIDTASREGWYWLAILLTFALGTAAGDWVAETMQLGYLNSTLLFAAAIGVVAIAHYGFKLGAVAAFWVAYILTRPLGASFGDLLSQPVSHGGLGWGTVGTSAVFLVAILALVVFLGMRGRARPA